MYSVLRSLIFKLDPELSHNLAIKSLKFNYNPVKNILIDSSIETNFFGKKINNPIGIAAGFDKNAEVYNPLYKLGFGFVEVGTVTPKKQYGNPKPRVFRLEEDEALINRLGFNNKGSNDILKRISNNLPNEYLGINIGPNKDTKNKIYDYLECYKKFHNLGNYIAINISSPNTENLRNFHNENELIDLLTAINEEKKKLKSKTPLAIKISPDIKFEQIDRISEILINKKIDILIVSNSTDKNREVLKNINKLEKGGLSGKPIEKISNNLISKFYRTVGKKVKIIGVGGVNDAKGVYDKISSGASLVQLYTGMVYEGPNIANKINKDLSNILIKEGIKNIGELIGTKNSAWRLIQVTLYKSYLMSKKCELTGKIPLKGHNVSHANNKTKRKFLPNLKKVRFKSEILKRSLKLNVSNAGVRSVDKKGSFDEFLKSAKIKNLSFRVKKLKKSILNKSS